MKLKNLNNQRGIALVFTLFFVVIFFIFQGILVLNAVHQTRMAAIEREQAQTFYVAHGGANAAIEELDVLINNYLQTTISNASPSGVITYAQNKVNSGDGVGWLVYAVRNNNNPVLTQNGEEASYSATSSLGGTNYTYSIVFSEKDNPAASGVDAWDFPYSYRIQATASRGSINTKVAVSGDFTVRVQRDNFAKFALYTNRQQMPNGTNVWFTDKTNFAGPVHTNDRFNFALNPSGTFQQMIEQEEQTARFYNNGNSVLLDNDHNGVLDVPVFHDGFERNADELTLNSATEETDMVSQAKGNNNYQNNGIYVPAQGSNLTGGIYVKGDGTVALSVDGSNRAVYTITQGSATRVITVDNANDQTIVTNPSNGNSTTYSGKPDGSDDVGTLIFVDGNITSLAGTVQSDSEVTVASHSDIVITNNVKYSSYTPATGTPGQTGYVPPSAEGYTNLLGIVSWGGDVRVGTTAPDNVQIHGTVMAENGIFSVDDYDDTGEGTRGTATLLGGAITDDYGAFGQFNGSTGAPISGYGRNFVYDGRMQAGKAPPYFPSLDTFIAFTNDITDKMVWQEGG